MNITQEQATTVSINSQDGGVCACFTTINEKWGFKWYWREEAARRTFDMQSKAFAAGWGPAIGPEVVCFKSPIGDDCWGYTTEIAQILGKLNPERGSWWGGDWYKRERNSVDFGAYNLPDFFWLAREAGIEPNDFHYMNIGWCDDKPVVIDFSECWYVGEGGRPGIDFGSDYSDDADYDSDGECNCTLCREG